MTLQDRLSTWPETASYDIRGATSISDAVFNVFSIIAAEFVSQILLLLLLPVQQARNCCCSEAWANATAHPGAMLPERGLGGANTRVVYRGHIWEGFRGDRYGWGLGGTYMEDSVGNKIEVEKGTTCWCHLFLWFPKLKIHPFWDPSTELP